MSDLETRMHQERAITLKMALEACPHWVSDMVLDWWLAARRTGGPLPVLLDLVEEADFWAAGAEPYELEAYLRASAKFLAKSSKFDPNKRRAIGALFGSLSPEDQSKFLAWAESNLEAA